MNNWLTWSLLSALFAGATAIPAKIGVTGIDSNFATAIRTTVILFFTWMIASFTRSTWSVGTISLKTDAQGKFEEHGLPPGGVTLVADKAVVRGPG